jgi:photosystem II stability/assembly factor-like uncharacterized protein
MWMNATANLAGMASECGNLSFVSAKPTENMLITGVSLNGLFASHDGGKSWTALGTGAGSDAVKNRISSVVYDPASTTKWWESGIYNAGGVYETQDDGVTVKALGNVTHCDLVSIDFTDPARKTILAGGHEQPQTLHRSTDGGATWSNVGGGLPGNSFCTNPYVVDGMTYVVGCNQYGNNPGIYRTTDGGSTWKQVSNAGGSYAPLVASDGSIYWSSPYGASVLRSTDEGQTWAQVVGSGATVGRELIELPNHWLATLGPKTVVVSKDHGATWIDATANLPYNDAVGVAYSDYQKAFFVWHFTCNSMNDSVPGDAIMRYNWDYTLH